MIISRRLLLGIIASLPAAGTAQAWARPVRRIPLHPGPAHGAVGAHLANKPGAQHPGKLPLVVLDPGHGGKDPGAIGYSGTYEKHVAFAAAQELERQLLKSGRYRVALTRGSDRFIPLEDRVAIAQEHGAALFVSMHADALSDHTVRGASVYTLSSAASDAQSAALAVRENDADRFGGPKFRNQPPDVARILASLVRRETSLASARLQRDMVDSLHQDIPLLENPARHAGFMVLKAADIPSVLVEMGFMSNPRDEADLRRADHRVRVAQAMHRAVDGYFAAAGGTA